ncbi:hypothetical protein Q5P01_011731 [Channa striata]|uniref:Uncharacterized protein n=1 Tax=Channa striata TaxID=64152 RepID=A0AA88N007_CHASR|nr:hypothetical protein Q5P01_011731 [Channa striata]
MSQSEEKYDGASLGDKQNKDQGSQRPISGSPTGSDGPRSQPVTIEPLGSLAKKRRLSSQSPAQALCP